MKTVQKFALIALCATQLAHATKTGCYLVPMLSLGMVAITSLVEISLNNTIRQGPPPSYVQLPSTDEYRLIVRWDGSAQLKTLQNLEKLKTSACNYKLAGIAGLWTSLLLRKPIVNLIHKAFPQKQSTNIEKLEEVEGIPPLIVINL